MPQEDALVVALQAFEQALVAMAAELTKLLDLRTLDDALLEGRYALIAAELQTIKATQARGLSGTVLGRDFTLRPPP